MCIRRLVIVAMVAVVSSAVHADVLFVDDDAPPGGDGLSWDTAYTFLRDAINHAAASGGAVDEIRVAQGTYRPDQFTPPDPDSTCCWVHGGVACDTPECEDAVCAAVPSCCDTSWDETCVLWAELFCGDLCEEEPIPPPTFHLLSGVALRGGFAGLGAPDPDARDIDAYPSVLFGDLDGDDGLVSESCCWPHETPGCDDPSLDEECEAAVCAALPYCCDTAWDILCAAVAFSSTYCDFESTCPEIFNNAEIVTGSDTDATAVLDGFTVTKGTRGIYVSPGAPTIRHCRFVDNTTGLYLFYGDPTIQHCTFSDNKIGMSLYGEPTVTDCTFSGNAGRGLWVHDGGTVTDCVFAGNASTWGAGLAMARGTVIGCTVSDNRAFFGGGGMELGTATVIGCTFSGNEAGQFGGGLSLLTGDAMVIGCTFQDNATSLDGGGVAVLYNPLNFDPPQIVNSLFVGNSADRGGGIFLRDPADLINCTFSGNTAASGGAQWVNNEADVINSVLWGNEPDEIAGDGTPNLTVRFSDVQGGFPGGGNIDADPLFVDPAAGDYRLGPGSPCIDAGRSQMLSALPGFRPGLCDGLDLDQDGDTVELIPVDLDGWSRFADDPDTPDTGCAAAAVVDMGAYESGAARDGERVVYADQDGDGEVTITDFLIVLGAWGPCDDPCCLADIPYPISEHCRVYMPNVGVVDSSDAWAVISWWGR